MNTSSRQQQPPSAALAVGSLEQVKSRALAARTVFDGIAGPTFRQVGKQHGPEALGVSAASIIAHAMDMLAPSRRLAPEQTAILADEIITNWPNESLEDVNVFVRGVGLGKYEGSAIYSVMDIPRMLDWWRDYLAEKALQMELGAGRAQDLEEQGMKQAIADIPGGTKALGDAVKEFVIDTKERSELMRTQQRLSKLVERVPLMLPDQLREAWRIYHTAEERSIIQAQAARLGLMGDEAKEAQLQVDAAHVENLKATLGTKEQ